MGKRNVAGAVICLIRKNNSVPKGKTEDYLNNAKNSKLWINTDDARKPTPGHKNSGVE